MAQTLSCSPAQIVRQLLVDLGLAADPGGTWPAYDSGEPDAPDNCITVTDTAGRQIGRSFVDGELAQLYGFQVRVRATDHPTGWLKADAIQTALAKSVFRRQVDVGGVPYLVWCASNIGPVLVLGTDVIKTKRKLFTLNAMLTVRAL